MAIKTYEIEITETLSRIIKIQAESSNEAWKKIKQMYKEEEIVLDSSDFVDTDIKLIGQE